MGIKERIKLIRKDAGLTQEKFGDRIGVGKVAVAYYESGARTPSARSIKAISEKFGINETWILSGEGDMKAPPSKEAEIASMAAEIINKDDPFRQRLIELIMQMDEDQMNHLKEMAVQLAKAAEE